MSKKYEMLLMDGTVGTVTDEQLGMVEPEFFIGKIITVYLQDENGNPIEKQGMVVEILSKKDY